MNVGTRRHAAASAAFSASLAFFEHSLDGVLYTSPDGTILDANAAACGLLGMSTEEICRRGRAGLAHPDDPRWAAGVRERARSGKFSGPLSFVKGDGAVVELDVSSAVFADELGEPRTVVVMRESSNRAPDAHDNQVLVDRSGVLTRPAFVQLVEQQCRLAARDRISVGLVYASVAPRADATEDAYQWFASILRDACRWGDSVGRISRDDFAVVIRDEDGHAVHALARRIHDRIGRQSTRSDRYVHAHVGTSSVDVATSDLSSLLDEAASRMREHEAWERAHAIDPPRCLFRLDAPTEVDHDDAGRGPNIELTRREREVLRLLATPGSYRQIAEELFVSLNTVKSHVSHLYTKLGVGSRREAIEKAKAAGYLDGAPGSADLGRVSLMANAFTAAMDAEEILNIVMMQGLAGLGADGAIIAFVVNDKLVPVAMHGYPEAAIRAFFPAALTRELPLTYAARETTMIWLSNRDEARRHFPELGFSPAAGSNAWIAAPLVADGQTFGAVGISFAEPHEFTAGEREYLETITNLCSLSLRRVRDEALLGSEVLRRESVIMRLEPGAGWPRGGWLLGALQPGARKQLLSEGYAIREDNEGRILVEPPR